MTSNKLTLWKANLLFFIAIILGILVGIPIVLISYTGLSMFSQDTFYASPIILVYTSPIWLGVSILGFLTDLIIVPMRVNLERYLVVEWLVSVLACIWPIIDNFSLNLPERWAFYIYFILLAFPCFYLKARYLARKGTSFNSIV
ncbi:hypothetical protein BH09BAC4_BH09BAC4_37560 [soil metagenome]